MSADSPIKLVPRNVAALRRGQVDSADRKVVTATVSGNSVATRLESGVGNCFPGLECDLRNLERRFFPLLEVDIADTVISIVGVDSEGVTAALAGGTIDASTAQNYRQIKKDLDQNKGWTIKSLRGTFGPMGTRQIQVSSLGSPGATAGDPPDAWTAIRLLTEGTVVEVSASRGGASRVISGLRQRYLDDNGALASIFSPGELTQSLCSPWTHDFRDCGCFYWASNHPDIAQPPRPDAAGSGPDWNVDVPWERFSRDPDVVPAPATSRRSDEIDHYEINQRWQELNFVLEGRELLGSYTASAPAAIPFATEQELETYLRYAAGVELAVMATYLTSAYSLRTSGATPILTDDITAAKAEIMRIAIGEMRHLRMVNNVLASIALRTGKAFMPAMRMARVLPGDTQPWAPQAATPQAIDSYIRLESPSKDVDGLYARILATLERDGTDEEEQTVRSIIAEGSDHFQTFEFVREWLGRHQPDEYLRGSNLVPPPPTDLRHRTLQLRFKEILEGLHAGYTKGLPAGAAEINQARMTMVQPPNSLAVAAQAVADAGFLVVFDALTDPRFVPVDPPQ